MRKFNALLCLLCTTLLISCGEDDPKKQDLDTETTLTITSPTANKVLIGVIDVKAEVEQVGFQRAEVYLNNTLIGESTNPLVDVNYDTRSIADGAYDLRLVAINENDEEEEISIDVEILNDLVTVTIPPNWLEQHYNDEIWFFITNDAGESLGAQQGNSNSTLTFQTPADYEKADGLVLHQLTYNEPDEPYGSMTRIASYPGITPGDTYQIRSLTTRSTVDNHQLTVTGVPATYNRVIMSGPELMNYSYMGTTTKTITVGLTASPANAVCYLTGLDRTLPGMYKTFANFTTGGTTSAAFGDFTAMQAVNFTLESQAEYLQGSVAYFTDASRTLVSNIDNFNTIDAMGGTLYYPGTFHDTYLMRVSQETGNKLYAYEKIGAISSTIKKLSADITAISYSDNVLDITSTGSYDFGLFESIETYTSDGTEHDLYWYVHTDNASTQQITIPQIPAEIITAIPELADSHTDFENGIIILSEFDGIDGYADYLKEDLQSSEAFFSKYNESTSLNIYLNDEWARKKEKNRIKIRQKFLII